MKLAKLEIENFRHLGTRKDPVRFDFTDPLGRVREFTLFCGTEHKRQNNNSRCDCVGTGPWSWHGLPAARLESQPENNCSARRAKCEGHLLASIQPRRDCGNSRDFPARGNLSESSRRAEIKLTWTYPAPKQPSIQPSVYAASASAISSGVWLVGICPRIMSHTRIRRLRVRLNRIMA